MERACMEFDLIVVGGGPAGAAAAIRASRLGLSTALLEVSDGPRFRPGESLAPGTADLIAQLLGNDAFAQLPKVAHSVINVANGSEQWQSPYEGRQIGIHVHRIELDEALLKAAAKAGARVFRPAAARSIDMQLDRVVIMTSELGSLTSPCVIDTTGGATWLIKKTQIEALYLSNPLEVTYGYSDSTDNDMNPCFYLDAQGWRWKSNIGSGRRVECAMAFEKQSRPHPAGSGNFRAKSTWCIASQLASPQFLLAGDAACKLDPASSRGVYRALVSGMAAADAVESLLGRHSAQGLDEYCEMMTGWFLSDCQRLNAAYQSASGRDDPIGFISKVSATFGVVI